MTDTAEKCKGCTIKHLSDVLVWLQEEDKPEIVRNAYISGNLSHAANHFIHYSPEIADAIRQLRLDCIGEDLKLSLSVSEIEARLKSIISDVAEYTEPTPTQPENFLKTTSHGKAPRTQKGGCRCHQNS